ncbi:MAG: CvpA family protein, partial [Bdellovibrionales bacterium]|nr:CvpA family protein [Bdellovibrionales bacterium]
MISHGSPRDTGGANNTSSNETLHTHGLGGAGAPVLPAKGIPHVAKRTSTEQVRQTLTREEKDHLLARQFAKESAGVRTLIVQELTSTAGLIVGTALSAAWAASPLLPALNRLMIDWHLLGALGCVGVPVGGMLACGLAGSAVQSLGRLIQLRKPKEKDRTCTALASAVNFHLGKTT